MNYYVIHIFFINAWPFCIAIFIYIHRFNSYPQSHPQQCTHHLVKVFWEAIKPVWLLLRQNVHFKHLYLYLCFGNRKKSEITFNLKGENKMWHWCKSCTCVVNWEFPAEHKAVLLFSNLSFCICNVKICSVLTFLYFLTHMKLFLTWYIFQTVAIIWLCVPLGNLLYSNSFYMHEMSL